ncbi:MAG: DUF1501 domain-containing protein [Chthoniobacter sp.]|nr:DUF1501 domain-containing protein [Chthoniobacter sp.]
MKKFLLQNRRQFLSTSLKGVGLLAASGYVPAFLARTANAVGPEAGAPILVVLQLSGGNDGLNTVVPLGDDLYYKARPMIGIPADAALKINDHLGLNSALAPLKAEYDAGRMAIVENVGYPNPNRSHFRSMEIWHTAADAEGRREITGWLGRYFDAQCKGADPRTLPEKSAIGMSFGKIMPQAFRNRMNVGVALDNPDTFQWNASGETQSLARAQEQIFEMINQPGGAAMQPRLETLGGIAGNEPDTLDFLRHTAVNAISAGDKIRTILSKAKQHTGYPNSGLSQQLQMISKLIAGNFPTRVYYAIQGGFDTHATQVGTQTRLLKDVADSLAAFTKDLRTHKDSERVLVLAFSEFGRRVSENASQGTDHGTAAPMFLFGEKIKAGLHGGTPNLADLNEGDLRHQVDFRQVYANVLEDWLGTPSDAILGRKFEKLPIV